MLFDSLMKFLVPITKLSFDSGGGGSNTTTATTIAYSPEEAARRSQVMDEAARLYGVTKDQIAGSAYPGAQPTAASANTLGAQQALLSAGQQVGASMPQVQQALNFGLTGALDVNNNPYLAQAVQAAINPVTQAYSGAGGTLSQIRTGAEEKGQFGGSRQGIAEALASRDYMQKVGDISSKMYSDAYSKGLDASIKSLSLVPETFQSYTLPSSWQSAVGAQQESYQSTQEAYDAAAREWQMNAPWLGLQNYANIVFGGGSGGGTTSSTSPAAETNPFMTALGAATMGTSLYNNIAPWFANPTTDAALMTAYAAMPAETAALADVAWLAAI